jgi:hypothetical protein
LVCQNFRNYIIEDLVETLNKILNEDDINIIINKGKDNIIFKKINNENNFTLYTNFNNYKNNILKILGFDLNQECINNNNYISNKSYDIRSDKLLNIYIKNISETEAICKIMLGTTRIHNFIQKLSTPIKNIKHLEIEIKDSQNRNIYFGEKYFNIEINLKGIGIINTIIVNENTISDEESLYDEINNLLS